MLSSEINATLNAQITWEFYSSYLYRQMASCLNSLGLGVLEARFLQQADEEQLHATRLIGYVQKAGGRLQLGAIDAPPNHFESPLAILEKTLSHEREVTRRIHALMAQAEQEKDYSTRSYLQWYIDEQVEEEASFAELTQLTRMAGENLLLLEERIEKLMAAKAKTAAPPPP